MAKTQNIKVFAPADCCYSREGLEGIVGYQVGEAYLTYEEAKAAVEQDLRKRYGDREGFNLIWEPASDDRDVIVCHSWYFSNNRRQDIYDEQTILEIDVKVPVPVEGVS